MERAAGTCRQSPSQVAGVTLLTVAFAAGLPHTVRASEEARNPHASLPVSNFQETALISGTLPGRLSERFLLAFALAAQRVSTAQACARLFDGLDSDGLTALRTTIYYAATHVEETRTCRLGVAAFTSVGGPRTRLCSRFGFLRREEGAIVLIHEALHLAGMDEAPHAPNGLTPFEINVLVKRRCGL